MNLFATKPLSRIMAEAEGEHALKRTLGPVQLVALGIGAIIGAGLFSLTDKLRHQYHCRRESDSHDKHQQNG